MLNILLRKEIPCGNAGPGDPEVIYLSPVEQNINKVLWNATPNFAISSHFFNVIVPNTGTGLSSFRLDGILVPHLYLFGIHRIQLILT
ncbi:MAG: hypothetical protein IPK57_20210 [Chitinophagaceae bacterium]|nr:hypothetical protein [Chitinophagaceae bacterium]